MKPQKIQFTKSGYEKMEKNFSDLTEKRKSAVVQLRTTREMGDLSENGAYKAARFELTSIDRELRRLTYLLRMGEIVESKNLGLVDFGSKVTVKNENSSLTFTLVSGYESDPKQMRLSVYSPMGKAVLGKKAGEKAIVYAPQGEVVYTITKIE